MLSASILPATIIKDDDRSFLNYLVKTGGPESEDYARFTSIINNLDPSQEENLREILNPILDESTLIGYGLKKPFGYPGDFNLINSIYEFHLSADPRYRKWDQFFQNQHGAIAVRNRKEYFLRYCSSLAGRGDKEIKVLILGSGPGTDVFEFLNRTGDRKISFDLVDFDQHAIDFSRNKNEKFNGNVSYHRINVLRFKPYRMYNMIWSAGLFDYFKEKHFIFLIRKYLSNLAPDGEFIISNFSQKNPTRRLMEVLSQWYLNHRSKTDLLSIALNAGVKEGYINIDTEPLGVNLFLKVRSEVSKF